MQNTSSLEYKKLNYKDFIQLLIWSYKFIFNLTGIRLIVNFFLELTIRNIGILNTLIIAKLIDEVVNITTNDNYSLSTLYLLLGSLAVYEITTYAISLILRINSNILDKNLRIDLDNAVDKKIMSLEINQLESAKVTDIITRAKNNTTYLRLLVDVSLKFTSDIISIIISSLIVLNYLPQIIPFIILIEIIKAFITYKNQEEIYKYSYINSEKNRIARRNILSSTYPNSLKELKIGNAFLYIYEKGLEHVKKYQNYKLKLRNKRDYNMTIFNFVGAAINFFSYTVIVFRAVNKVISIGDISFQASIINRFSRSITNISHSYIRLVDNSFYANDVKNLFYIENNTIEGDIKLDKIESGPDIEINNLSFKYPDSNKYSLKDIDIKIKSGEKVAIVGHNGAGKTTLIKLISKIYDYDKGSILINNTPLNKIEKNSYYNNLAVLFQDFNTYGHLSVKENIIIGRPAQNNDEEKIKEVAKKADASEFINKYDNKFDQILSTDIKNGTRPSQGEWQKIAIARFFYRDAPLVIFDEPTSAIDAVSEYNIFNRIYKFFKGKTVILISHRFSTVRNADKIFVLDKGKIVEVGSHDELMKMNGVYAHSFNLQAEGYK